MKKHSKNQNLAALFYAFLLIVVTFVYYAVSDKQITYIVFSAVVFSACLLFIIIFQTTNQRLVKFFTGYLDYMDYYRDWDLDYEGVPIRPNPKRQQQRSYLERHPFKSALLFLLMLLLAIFLPFFIKFPTPPNY